MPVWLIESATAELFLNVPEIWGHETWCTLTGLTAPPWEDGNVPEEWKANDEALLKHVRAYVAHLDAIDGEEKRRQDLESKAHGNLGRATLMSWLKEKIRKEWKVQQLVLDVMKDASMTPAHIMAEEKLSKVSNGFVQLPIAGLNIFLVAFN